jgi:predicted metal-dependent peptidase
MIKSRGKIDDTLAAMFTNIAYTADYLFYAHLIGQCDIVISEVLPAPAGVAFKLDHYVLYINPSYFDKYTLLERLAILKHEMLHILLDHVVRQDERDSLMWNFATDCALNQLIDKTHLPENCILPESLSEQLKVHVPSNESGEHYYELIKDTIQKNNNCSCSTTSTSFDGLEQFDDHSTWQTSTGDKELVQDITKRMIEKSQSETIKGNGTIPSECADWIAIYTRKSELNWKKVLRGIVGNKHIGRRSTIMRSDRRFPQREELRGKVKDRMFNLLVISDVSGSMSTEAIAQTLSEVQHICDVTKTDVNLIQVDSIAYAPEKLSKKTKNFKRNGIGGTMLYSAIDMAKKHNVDYQAVVVLTDGYLDINDIEQFKSLNMKVIWLIAHNGNESSNFNEGKMQSFKLKGN